MFLDKINEILNDLVNKDVLKIILIDCFGDKCEFSDNNEVKLSNDLLDIFGLKNKIYIDTNHIFDTNNTKIKATDILHAFGYQKNHIKTIFEIANYLGFSQIELLQNLEQRNIKNDQLDKLKEELDSLKTFPYKNILTNEALNFQKLNDTQTKSLLLKLQVVIELNLFINQLYKSDFIDFDEYIKTQNFIAHENEICKLNLMLNQNSISAFGLLDNYAILKKDEKYGFVLSFPLQENKIITYSNICELSNLHEPYKYGIEQILLNSNISPNEILIKLFSNNQTTLSKEQRNIFNYAISFCKINNSSLMINDFLNDTSQKNIQDDTFFEYIQIKNHQINNYPLYIFDNDFYETALIKQKNIEKKLYELEFYISQNQFYKISKDEEIEKIIKIMQKKALKTCEFFLKN